MYNAKMILMLLLPYFFFLKERSVEQHEYTFKKVSRDCLVLYKNGIPLDSLFIYLGDSKSFNRNQILEEINGNVYSIQQKTPPIDNFAATYFFIEEWEVKNEKFRRKSSLKIPLGNCHARKIKISLIDEGVRWRYKRGFFKKTLKGLIPYHKLNELAHYNLPCE